MNRIDTVSIAAIGLLAILLLLAIWFVAAQYSRPPEDVRLAEVRVQSQIDTMLFETTFWQTVKIVFAAIAAVGTLLLLLAATRAIERKNSVCTAKIGKHSEIPVDRKDLQNFYPIAVNLSLAEIEASVNHANRSALQTYDQLVQNITEYTRALAGKRGLIADMPALAPQTTAALPAPAVPTFADLLQSGEIAPGKPLILGYHQGQPEHRDIPALKSLAVSGWQGSGKTVSMAYIIASSTLAYGMHVYVVDPHRGHDKGLYTLIQPLEQTGQVHVVNPFETPKLIHDLNTTLNRRLRGDESSAQGILLVIDELARLAKLECFDELIIFLERCTEETRKANMTFIGGSQKWTARHFKGRADIRACMNSALVHKTKPSQAELLLEDNQDKKMVKQLQRPGDAILVTDFADARMVSMPFCTRADIEQVATMIEKSVIDLKEKGFLPPHPLTSQKESLEGTPGSDVTQTELDEELEVMLALPKKHMEPLEDLSTEELLRARTQKLLNAGTISYGKIHAETGIAKSTANGFVNAGKNLKSEQQTALRSYLEQLEREVESTVSQA